MRDRNSSCWLGLVATAAIVAMVSIAAPSSLSARQASRNEPVRVEGRVTIVGAPVSGAIAFADRTGTPPVFARTGRDGRFHTVLPHPGKWWAKVDSGNDMDAARTILVAGRAISVEVESRPAGQPTRLNIELPDTKIVGRVLFEDGSPAGGALFAVKVPLYRVSVLGNATGSSGAFEIRGLGEGTVWISAQSVDRSGLSVQARQRPIVVASAGTTVEPVVLTLEPERQVQGSAIDAAGKPLARAQVLAWPLAGGHATSPVVAEAVTEADGHFHLTVPQGTDRLLLTIVPWERDRNGGVCVTSLALPAQGSLTVRARAGSGTVIVSPPAGVKTLMAPRFSVALFQNGLLLGSPQRMMRWTKGHERAIRKERSTFANLAPGAYSACPMTLHELAKLEIEPTSYAPGPDCERANLAPGGTIRFDFSHVKEPKE